MQETHALQWSFKIAAIRSSFHIKVASLAAVLENHNFGGIPVGSSSTIEMMTGMVNFWTLFGMLAVLMNQIGIPFQAYLNEWILFWKAKLTSYHCFRIPQFLDTRLSQNMYLGFGENELYRMGKTYVGTLKGVVDTTLPNLYSSKDSEQVFVCLESGQSVEDEFRGVKVSWTHEVVQNRSSLQEVTETKSFYVKMLKRHKSLILDSYLQHVRAVALEAENKNKNVQLFTNSNTYGGATGREMWSSMPFRHPAAFDTIALDSHLKDTIKTDLDNFVQRKEFYKGIGKAWKRGYLFYGPPGTGKSSMIAAMANYLHFDIYDLELSKVLNNSQLRNLLMQTRNKSILVIEDIDCTIESVKREENDQAAAPNFSDVSVFPQTAPKKSAAYGVTLSGLLNFIDGLWSCCGEERIVVFTTNNKEKLDSALLRPGRMDVHIYFPPCCFSAFKQLANNYFKFEDHDQFPAVEKAFGLEGASLTPAEVAEIFLSNLTDPASAISSVVLALQHSACSNE